MLASRYKAAVRALPGTVKTPEKDVDGQHVEWLALHQVGEWSYDRISAKYLADTKTTTIADAVTRLAALIGLTLRPGPGRSANSR